MRALNKAAPLGIAFLFLAIGVVLIFQRGGLLAWLAVILGAALLVKFWLRPMRWDLRLCAAIATLWLCAWPAVFFYVISTWETGEVIELTIESPLGDYKARTWILEEPGALILYYDAPAEPAAALLSGSAIEVMRGGKSLATEGYSATRVDDMAAAEVDRLFGLMAEKYGDRNAATDIYYGFLGRSGDRVGVVIEISEGATES